MDFVKKCKRLLRSSKSIFPEESCSGSYGELLSEKCHKKQKHSHKKPPNGCVCVYVGPERQRFIIKIKVFNHSLFKSLLEDVENEYGYEKDGPLWLSCEVELFNEALVEIENAMDDDMGYVGCNFRKSHGHKSYSKCSMFCHCNSMSHSVANCELLV